MSDAQKQFSDLAIFAFRERYQEMAFASGGLAQGQMRDLMTDAFDFDTGTQDCERAIRDQPTDGDDVCPLDLIGGVR